MHQNHMQGLLKHRLLGPVPRISDLVGLGQSGEFLFLTISWMMMVLLVQDHTLGSIVLISRYLPGSLLIGYLKRYKAIKKNFSKQNSFN